MSADSHSATLDSFHSPPTALHTGSLKGFLFLKPSYSLVLKTVTEVTHKTKPRCHRNGLASSSPALPQPSRSSLKLNYQLEHEINPQTPNHALDDLTFHSRPLPPARNFIRVPLPLTSCPSPTGWVAASLICLDQNSTLPHPSEPCAKYCTTLCHQGFLLGCSALFNGQAQILRTVWCHCLPQCIWQITHKAGFNL